MAVPAAGLRAEIAAIRSRRADVVAGNVQPPDLGDQPSVLECLMEIRLAWRAGLRPLAPPTASQVEAFREHRRRSWARREIAGLDALLKIKEEELRQTAPPHGSTRASRDRQSDVDRTLAAHPHARTLTLIAELMDDPVDRGTLGRWLRAGDVVIPPDRLVRRRRPYDR